MKRLVTVGLIVNAVLLAVVVVLLSKGRMETVHAGGGGTPFGNGDVNGDGAIDISDAVYLLSSLFLGGSAPVAIECPPPAAKGLPATGQTLCYGIVEGLGWVEVPCEGATCPGQDGFYKAGCPTEGRFVDNGDGTVTDNCTGLMWQKDTADVNGDGAIDDKDRLDWCGALSYSGNLSFAGHDDWRLPNVRELQSIVDYGRSDPSIDPVFGAVPDFYWSSSAVVNSFAGYAWNVLFLKGSVSGYDFEARNVFVRAVRSGP